MRTVILISILFLLGACNGGSSPGNEGGGPPSGDGGSGEGDVAPGPDEEDVPCVPICTDKECGDDGCGASCGKCPGGATCLEDGICDDACQPDCGTKECGDDGCGGSCGECPGGGLCLDGGVCQDVCVPDCDGPDGPKECGNDGCGGSCGECPGGGLCLDGGVCEACEANCTGKKCGDDGCGGSCGDCPPDEECDDGACVEVCVPDCDGKECGDDGCGGSCGDCLPGFGCDEGVCVEICVPDCDGKECGDDGCGGICDDCLPGFGCDEGVCVEICVPDCDGKDCGGDGCGGVCGVCGPNEYCAGTTCLPEDECLGCAPWQTCEQGTCVDPPSAGESEYGGEYIAGECYGVDWIGCCAGDVLYYCDDQSGSCPLGDTCLVVLDCGADGAGCGWGTSFFMCVASDPLPGPDGSLMCDWYECTPVCDGVACGPDGCGGSCGSCPGGKSCVEGECVSATCEGFCGEQAPTGCWCDSECFQWGDCCDDLCAMCPETPECGAQPCSLPNPQGNVLRMNAADVTDGGLPGYALDVDDDPGTCSPEGNCQGGLDNQLGGLLGQVEQYVDMSAELAAIFDEGEVHYLAWLEGFNKSGVPFTMHMFTGSASAPQQQCDWTWETCPYIVAAEQFDLVQCRFDMAFTNATVIGNQLVAGGPGFSLPMTFPLSELPLEVQLDHARVEGVIVTQDGALAGLEDAILGGAIKKQALLDSVYLLPDDLELPVSKELIVGMLDMFIVPDIDTDGDGQLDAASMGLSHGAIEAVFGDWSG